jgi:hypothetical protein
MKLALVTPATKRQVRRERLRRSHATALALREVFPAVQQLRLEFLFRGGSTSPAMQSRVLYAAARAFFEFPCPYADCDGQFDLGTAVKAALENPTHGTAGELECSGTRVVRMGASEACQLRLNYAVTAVLAPDT